VTEDTFKIPEGLSAKGRKAAEVIVAHLKKRGLYHSGGCKVFYTPAEWEARGEKYGHKSLLVICHDGGCHSYAFNPDYEQYDEYNARNDALSKVGCYVENCTSWYSAVYPL